MTILIVCTGNTCRSPMAEGMLRSLLTEHFGPDACRVISAGTDALDGDPAAEHAVTVLREKGIDISNHQAKRLTADLISEAELILAMTDRHQEVMVALVSDAQDKIQVLSMEDPFGMPLEVYRVCAAQLEEQLKELIDALEKEGWGEGRKKNNGEE